MCALRVLDSAFLVVKRYAAVARVMGAATAADTRARRQAWLSPFSRVARRSFLAQSLPSGFRRSSRAMERSTSLRGVFAEEEEKRRLSSSRTSLTCSRTTAEGMGTGVTNVTLVAEDLLAEVVVIGKDLSWRTALLVKSKERTDQMVKDAAAIERTLCWAREIKTLYNHCMKRTEAELNGL